MFYSAGQTLSTAEWKSSTHISILTFRGGFIHVNSRLSRVLKILFGLDDLTDLRRFLNFLRRIFPPIYNQGL